MKNLKQRWGIRSNFHLLIIFIVLRHYRQCISPASRASHPLARAYSRKYQSLAILADPYLIDFSNLPGDSGGLWFFIWRVPIFLEL